MERICNGSVKSLSLISVLCNFRKDKQSSKRQNELNILCKNLFKNTNL